MIIDDGGNGDDDATCSSGWIFALSPSLTPSLTLALFFPQLLWVVPGICSGVSPAPTSI